MDRWLLVRGTGERPLPERVTPESLRRHSSTRRPAVQKGDLAVCYASRWQVVFALVEVTGDPENDPERTRWRWSFAIRPLLLVAARRGRRRLPAQPRPPLLRAADRGAARRSSRCAAAQ
jgi:hypothetical protein